MASNSGIEEVLTFLSEFEKLKAEIETENELCWNKIQADVRSCLNDKIKSNKTPINFTNASKKKPGNSSQNMLQPLKKQKIMECEIESLSDNENEQTLVLQRPDISLIRDVTINEVKNCLQSEVKLFNSMGKYVKRKTNNKKEDLLMIDENQVFNGTQSLVQGSTTKENNVQDLSRTWLNDEENYGINGTFCSSLDNQSEKILLHVKLMQEISPDEIDRFFGAKKKQPNPEEMFGKFYKKRPRTSSASWPVEN